MDLRKTKVYGLITDNGDGSSGMEYYFHNSQAEAMAKLYDDSSPTIKEIETYEGANITSFARANQHGHFCTECYTIEMSLDEFIRNDGICSICKNEGK